MRITVTTTLTEVTMFERIVSWATEVSIGCLELAGMANNEGKYDSTVTSPDSVFDVANSNKDAVETNGDPPSKSCKAM